MRFGPSVETIISTPDIHHSGINGVTSGFFSKLSLKIKIVFCL